MLRNLLAHPLTRGKNIDAPETTEIRARIIREKPFLRKIYDEWYDLILASLPNQPGAVLELGSGGGFLSERLPSLISSDVFFLPFVSLVASGLSLPIQANTLRAIVMVDVLHHLPDLPRFFKNAAQAVASGGVVAMIEPWNTPWSQFVYTRFHHESMDLDAKEWTSGSRPLADANIALPWIIFNRDRERFEREFPQWKIRTLRPFMPIRYLLSGGISLRSLMPGWSFGFWKKIEALVSTKESRTGMFAHIILQRE